MRGLLFRIARGSSFCSCVSEAMRRSEPLICKYSVTVIKDTLERGNSHLPPDCLGITRAIFGRITAAIVVRRGARERRGNDFIREPRRKYVNRIWRGLESNLMRENKWGKKRSVFSLTAHECSDDEDRYRSIYISSCGFFRFIYVSDLSYLHAMFTRLRVQC